MVTVVVMRVVATAGLAGLLLLVGCPTAAADPDPVAVPEVPLDPARTVFADNAAIIDPHLTRIESFSRDGDRLLVNFTAGTPDRFGVHVTTQETADAVTIDLRGGTPRSPSGGCASPSRCTAPPKSRCRLRWGPGKCWGCRKGLDKDR